VLHITQVGRVMVPVADQDQAIAFYTSKLGFSLVADVPYGEGDRWVEVAPPGGGTALALVPPRGDYTPGRMTGIALASGDARGDHAELKRTDVDVDEQLIGGDGAVPLLFFFRDPDGNHLMVVQQQ
jgi:catechol 2,3-dioxygenase-like lactoylglutathione lyase family enzyme